MLMNIMILLITAFVFTYIGYVLRRYLAEKKIQDANLMAKHILDLAQKEVDTRKKEIELESKDLLLKMRTDFERETKDRREELVNLEKRLVSREENLDRRVELLEKKEKDLELKHENIRRYEDSLKAKDKQLETMIAEEKVRLQKISSLTPQEAKQVYLNRLADELIEERAKLIRKMEEEVKETADKKAKEYLSLAIQRCAVEHTVESTVSVVNLPGEEMKGRIIGREGRNIRALEMATGIDVIIDDTPEAVTLSGFDPIRREIARLSLEKLISDGRIHPGRIEEIVEKVKKELEQKIQEEGEKASFDAGVHGLHPELVKLLGRLKYRTSYGQNVLQHSKEVAYLLGGIAAELHLDVRLARRIGLLHDIGKAADHQVEGTHAQIGADIARKYGESQEVLHAISAHHEEQEPKTLYAVLAAVSDAISAARPGARRETLETYIKRLEKLESIANVFKGVEKAFAIQAGREIRVIVQPDKISDSESIVLAQDIRKRIEEDLEYPGQIKITVIRETRVIDYAK